jgi:hypothetical protein
MVQPYRTLVRELEDTGFRVTPAPDKDIINLGDEIRPAVVKALEEAEASIHLLGARTGGRPDGLEMDLGPMQLAAAADEAKRRPKFERLIWAPIILPSGTSDEAKTARDPLEILGRFGQRLLETDQIDGDTASRFNEFVLQRLGRTPSEPSPEREVDRKIVYIRPGSNRKFAVEIAKELKQVGFNPVLNPPPPLFGQPQHIVVLWGSQSQTKLLEEISAIDSSRKAAQPAGGQLILLVVPGQTETFCNCCRQVRVRQVLADQRGPATEAGEASGSCLELDRDASGRCARQKPGTGFGRSYRRNRRSPRGLGRSL